jgi:hypothetical protein
MSAQVPRSLCAEVSILMALPRGNGQNTPYVVFHILAGGSTGAKNEVSRVTLVIDTGDYSQILLFWKVIGL